MYYSCLKVGTTSSNRFSLSFENFVWYCYSLIRKLLHEFTITQRVFSLIDNIKTNSKLGISLFTIVLVCSCYHLNNSNWWLNQFFVLFWYL
jgi:hypothetical protein